MGGIKVIMKIAGSLALLWTAVLLAGSCRRRPLTVVDNSVFISVRIEGNIVNYVMENPPELMRVAFFEHNTGRFVNNSFLPPAGGYVDIEPGNTYDVIVYNFDTKRTFVQNEYDFEMIYATTEEESRSRRNKLRSRSTKNEGEIFAVEPDHLFAGSLEEVYIPARDADSPEVVIDIDVITVVESWKVEVDRIQGREWVRDVVGVVTGLSAGNHLSTRTKSEDAVSVLFDSVEIEEDGSVMAVFNTFGYVPGQSQTMTLVVTDTAGAGHEFNMDISSQFVDNELRTIKVVSDEIVIDKPNINGSGGGLSPDVDEWQNIETDIII